MEDCWLSSFAVDRQMSSESLQSTLEHSAAAFDALWNSVIDSLEACHCFSLLDRIYGTSCEGQFVKWKMAHFSSRALSLTSQMAGVWSPGSALLPQIRWVMSHLLPCRHGGMQLVSPGLRFERWEGYWLLLMQTLLSSTRSISSHDILYGLIPLNWKS